MRGRRFSGTHRLGYGFTLLEILVVTAIIALLAALLIPSFVRARRHTKRTICMGYDYNLSRGDDCSRARTLLAALDCGCYGELGKGLSSFQLPEGQTPETYRVQLDQDAARFCK